MIGFKNMPLRNRWAILRPAILLLPIAAFPFSRLVALSLLLAIVLTVLAKRDRSGGIYFTLFLLVLIVLAVSVLLIFGLAYIHKVVSG